MKKLLPIGTPVFYLQRGWGKISNHNSFGIYNLETTFTLSVDDNKEYHISFTPDGKLLEDDTHPLLSLTEYSLESGGLTPISEYWNTPRVGDWGFFWENDTSLIVFGQLTYIGPNGYLTKNVEWKNFSHEVPPHVQKQM